MSRVRIPRVLVALSLHSRLVALVVATVLPLLGFGLVQIYLNFEAERANFTERTTEIARAIARAVQADHDVRVSGLQALAGSRALRTGDLEAFRAVAQDFINRQPAGSTLGVADQTGQLLLAIGDVPRGMPL